MHSWHKSRCRPTTSPDLVYFVIMSAVESGKRTHDDLTIIRREAKTIPLHYGALTFLQLNIIFEKEDYFSFLAESDVSNDPLFVLIQLN